MEAQTVEIKLSRAITVAGDTCDTLTMSEPRLKDREIFSHIKPGADGNHVSAGDLLELAFKAARVLCNLTPKEAESLSMIDAQKVAEAAMGFFTERKAA